MNSKNIDSSIRDYVCKSFKTLGYRKSVSKKIYERLHCELILNRYSSPAFQSTQYSIISIDKEFSMRDFRLYIFPSEPIYCKYYG